MDKVYLVFYYEDCPGDQIMHVFRKYEDAVAASETLNKLIPQFDRNVCGYGVREMGVQ
jgi:hypothetical protein